MSGPLKIARHEQFAVLMAGGLLTQTAAYREVYGEKSGGDRALRANAARLIATDNVAARIAELRAEVAAKLADAQATPSGANGIDLDWLVRQGKDLFIKARDAKEYNA